MCEEYRRALALEAKQRTNAVHYSEYVDQSYSEFADAPTSKPRTSDFGPAPKRQLSPRAMRRAATNALKRGSRKPKTSAPSR